MSFGPNSATLARVNGPNPDSNSPARQPLRWWPALAVLVLAASGILWIRTQADWAFQKRNLTTVEILLATSFLLSVWWLFFSRAPRRWRWGALGLAVLGGAIAASLFRIRGVSGDLLPILELRWAQSAASVALPVATTVVTPPGQQSRGDEGVATTDFPQFLGPNRDGVLPGPKLETNWTAHPPALVWRQKIGAAWSGFAIVGDRAVTQEQQGDEECVVTYDLLTGKELWRHRNPARYNTTIAGDGPRATPTVVSNRVFTFGGTGLLNCLDLATGRVLWSHDVVQESGSKVLPWGCASSPLLANDLVIVHGGDHSARSLFAFRAADGQPAWSAGNTNGGYAPPLLATLAGVPQVLAFNQHSVSAHDPATGATFWERPWGRGQVVCATPVVVNSNRVLFSSGYGVGAELLEVSAATNGPPTVSLVWKSLRMKSKFAHLFVRDGCVFGLDDGIFACVDLKDGSQRWKEGRYGHGQGLLVGELYLLMAESGELVLLQPTPAAPNELARFRVFNSKTWNPIALSGDLLLVRNDQEAAGLRLALAKP